MKMFRFLAMMTFAGIAATEAGAQVNCFSSEIVAVYQKIIARETTMDKLDQETFNCVIALHSVLTKSNAPNDSSECQEAWDSANSAADDVETYAKRLISCVQDGDHSDTCYFEASRVKSYHYEYESAVSDVNSYCQ